MKLDTTDGRAVYLHRAIFPAAYALLPAFMRTPEADAMILATGLQESKFLERRQIGGGPARGFWQFEEDGGVAGVLRHPRTSTWIAIACSALQYPATVPVCYTAIEHNDVLAAVFARLLLWTLPGPLPGRGESITGWDQYLDGWRPGKPHRATWDDCFETAWRVVDMTEPWRVVDS